MWPFKEDETVTRAKRITRVLEALDISKYTEQGRELRNIVALELIGEQHDMVKNYSATKFTSSADTEKIKQALWILKNNGLIKNGQLSLDKASK